MNRRISFLVTALVVAVFLTAPAFGQKKTRQERREEANARSLQGLVVGVDNNPANGAIVQIKDMRTLQIRSFITQSDGQYRFYGLKMDTDYQITVKSGDAVAGPRNLSVFDARKEAIINFKLENK